MSSQDNQDKQKHGSKHGSKSDGSNDGGASANIIALINAIADKDDTEREQNRGQERRRTFREWVAIIITLAAAAGIITQAIILSGQLQEMVNAGKQSDRAIEVFQAIFETMRDSSQKAESDRRPLLSVKATISEPMKLAPGIISARTHFTINNAGASETKASLAANMFLQSRHMTLSIAAEQNAACKEAGPPSISVGRLVGVADKAIVLGVSGGDFNKGIRSETETRNLIFIPLSETIRYVNPIIIGCVRYGADSDPHQLKFIGYLTRTNGGGLVVKAGNDPIPADELTIEITVTSSN